jgi:exosortase
MSISTAPTTPHAPFRVSPAQLAALVGLLGWAYLPMLRVFFDKWANDPQYSHGFLVPFFSAYLLWRAWQNSPVEFRPAPVLGCGLLGLVLGVRAVAGSILFHQLDALSFLLALAALSLAAGGFALLKRTAPAILFLAFMIPLPYELERNVGQPLKNAATVSSTFLLQTLGQPAVRDGNLILIDEVKLGVVDACSGLKMMVTFAAFAVGAVLLMQRTRFEKMMVLLGIIPIAVAANVLRITVTGLGHVWITDAKTLDFLHDLHGWLMMPVGLALLGVQVWALRRLVIDDEPAARPA